MENLVSSIRHWRGRRELSRLIGRSTGRRTDTRALVAECIEILDHCPDLAEERFPHHSLSNRMNIYPLCFLLMNGASLESIRRIHSYYPNAACRKVTTKSVATDYPLHLACVLGGVSEELILFLANAYPAAVAIKNSSGSLPIHVLMRNRRRQFTKHEVKTLVDHYESIRGPFWGYCTHSADTSWKITKGDWREGNNDFGAALALAVRNDNVDPQILDFLVTRFPANTCDAFYLGRVNPDFSVGFFLRQNTNYTMTEARIRALCALLPCLKVFSCTPKNWSTSAFLVLTTKLCQNTCLVEVTLSCPPSLFHDGEAPTLSLQRLLEENRTLQRLHIDFPAFCKSMQVEEVEAVAKGKFRTCLKLFWGALRNNTTLKACQLSGDLVALLDSDFRSLEFWPSLASVLQSQNTTLESIAAEPFRHEHATIDMRKVEYWTSLNRHGRARLRDPSIRAGDIVSVLAAARKSLRHEKNELMTLRVLYGLMLDSPSVWARQATVRWTPSTDIGEGRTVEGSST